MAEEEHRKPALHEEVPNAGDLLAQLAVAQAQIKALNTRIAQQQKVIDDLTREGNEGDPDRRRLQAAEKEFERLTNLIGEWQEKYFNLGQKFERAAQKEPGKFAERFEPGQRISTDPNLVDKGVKPGSVEDLSKPGIVVETFKDDEGIIRTTLRADVGKATEANTLAEDDETVFVRFTTETDTHSIKGEGKGAVQVKSTIGMAIPKEILTELAKQAKSPKSSNAA